VLDYRRILKARKHTDPTDPDPQQWFRRSDKRGISNVAGVFCFNTKGFKTERSEEVSFKPN
jgi:hypothetical protein